jgi:2-polyprenyl-6-methoxyphenol hydroxylase-like FAD-dependent oxidoreductase
MTQWDFLDFIAAQGARYPSFRLMMRAEATGLVEEAGRVLGVRATTPDGPLDIRARLVVGADGRHSTIRTAAGLVVDELGAPMDVLWFHLPRRAEDTPATLGWIERGRILVMINRGEQWQCGFVIPKGASDEVHALGLPAFRDSIAALAPFVRDRVGSIADWDEVKLLTVAVDRLRNWHRPGLLCIGDAAHAMSPIGGVGINLAIQDAVAAANILAEPLRADRLSEDHLRQVQRRRQFPTRATQALQLFVQNRVIRRVLGGTGPITPPLLLRFISRWPVLRRLPARLIGLGFRPEHVRTPDVFAGR